MSETQLRDIPYTVVETNGMGKGHKKLSPKEKQKHLDKQCRR